MNITTHLTDEDCYSTDCKAYNKRRGTKMRDNNARIIELECEIQENKEKIKALKNEGKRKVDVSRIIEKILEISFFTVWPMITLMLAIKFGTNFVMMKAGVLPRVDFGWITAGFYINCGGLASWIGALCIRVNNLEDRGSKLEKGGKKDE
jgi:hypothetical protein